MSTNQEIFDHARPEEIAAYCARKANTLTRLANAKFGRTESLPFPDAGYLQPGDARLAKLEEASRGDE